MQLFSFQVDFYRYLEMCSLPYKKIHYFDIIENLALSKIEFFCCTISLESGPFYANLSIDQQFIKNNKIRFDFCNSYITSYNIKTLFKIKIKKKSGWDCFILMTYLIFYLCISVWNLYISEKSKMNRYVVYDNIHQILTNMSLREQCTACIIWLYCYVYNQSIYKND